MVSTEYNREVCIMQNAETVLNVIRERGERGLPLENIYRLLYNRELYLRAYGRLYSNQGAMTKGTTAETVDGMSLSKIDRIIDKLRHRRGGGARPCDTTGCPGRRTLGVRLRAPGAGPRTKALRREAQRLRRPGRGDPAGCYEPGLASAGLRRLAGTPAPFLRVGKP